MLPILTAEAVRAAERAHLRELTDGTLMQRAATAVATECLAVLKQHGHVVGRHVLLLVGRGDNGGDALFAGAVLARRGCAVMALPVAGAMHAAGMHALLRAGGRVLDLDEALRWLDGIDIVIDGIVGLGSSRGLDGDAAFIVRAIDDAQLFTVAVDVPSGVHADTGAIEGVAVTADVTVTFGALRRCHVIAPAALRCGEVLVADIGVPMDSDDHAATSWWRWFAPPPPSADKYARGVVGVVTGSTQYPGAALLSVGGALRSGCGMVRYFGSSASVVGAHPEVVPGQRSDVIDGRCQAWVVGCGLGTDADARATVAAVLARPQPVVIDADAITLLADDLALRAQLAARATSGALSLLTPHAAELRRLADALDVRIDIADDRLGAAKAVASALRTIVLLKGPSTLVTDGTHFVATPLLGAQLATAGSGDVLAGLLAGAAARWQAEAPLSASAFMELAAAAALRHGSAAAPADTIASDLLVGLDAEQ